MPTTFLFSSHSRVLDLGHKQNQTLLVVSNKKPPVSLGPCPASLKFRCTRRNWGLPILSTELDWPVLLSKLVWFAEQRLSQLLLFRISHQKKQQHPTTSRFHICTHSTGKETKQERPFFFFRDNNNNLSLSLRNLQHRLCITHPLFNNIMTAMRLETGRRRLPAFISFSFFPGPFPFDYTTTTTAHS
jgi:hypothetical protein